MKNEDAVSVLLQAVNIAQQKGAFTLKDASVVAQAVEILSKKEENSQENPQTVEKVIAEKI